MLNIDQFDLFNVYPYFTITMCRCFWCIIKSLLDAGLLYWFSLLSYTFRKITCTAHIWPRWISNRFQDKFPSSGRITPTKRTEELVKNFYAADYKAFGFWREHPRKKTCSCGLVLWLLQNDTSNCSIFVTLHKCTGWNIHVKHGFWSCWI